MSMASIPSPALPLAASHFDLDNEFAYQRWRAAKLAQYPLSAEALVVEVRDPRHLTATESGALRALVARANMAIYHSPVTAEDKEIPRALGAQMGLHQLDANWLADDDGISSIAVSGSTHSHADAQHGDRAGFIPYTNRRIRWHTDGYYHPDERRIHAMVLHCVRPARGGGVNALLDHEMAYITLRDLSPGHVHALMQPDAMTIPERTDADGVARAAQPGPVFSVGAQDGQLHMRYTARTRSILWKPDAATQAAVACLEALLEGGSPWILRAHMEAGMGLLCNNVLHDRSSFEDDAACPRLLYRARFLDRVSMAD
jgi:hypothetical protein